MTVSDADFAARLLASLRSGLLGVDARGRVAALSGEAAEALGLLPAEPEAWLGRPLDEVLAAHPPLRALLREALAGHQLPARSEMTIAGADGGDPRTLGFTLVNVAPGADGAGAAVLFRDLTPFERRDEQERLRDRLAALGEMAAGLAHEIRNPLASLEVLTGLLKRSLADAPVALELVEELHEELRHLTATVNARLEFMRPVVVRRRLVALAPIARAALAEVRARRAHRGPPPEVEVAFEPEGIAVDADPDQLRALLANLLQNAVEALDRAPGAGAPRVRIAASADPAGGVRIAVEDSGPGVPPADRERIFHPFFTTRAEGTGVGLAEVQRAVAAHGGSIAVRESELGGALFVLHLPDAGEGPR